MPPPTVLILLGDFVAASARGPYQTLLTLGYDVDLADPHKRAGDAVKTSIPVYVGEDRMFTERRGRDLGCTVDFDAVSADDYDGLVLPGGRAPEYLADVDAVRQLVRAMDAADKPILANCHGTQVIAAAGIVEGRRCTGIARLRTVLENAGAEWVAPSGTQGNQSRVVTDGNLVTGSQSKDYPALLQAFVGQLGGTLPIA